MPVSIIMVCYGHSHLMECSASVLIHVTVSDSCSDAQVADNGTFSGTSEAAYILGLLKSTYSAPQNAIPCQSLVTGTLFGQPVVLITSGTPELL